MAHEVSRQLLWGAAVLGLIINGAALAWGRDGNPPGPRGGPGTNWENPPGPRGGPGAGPDRDWGPAYGYRYRDRYYVPRWRDDDNNPPGPWGGPGTDWENPPGWRGGPGASPDRGPRGWAPAYGYRYRVRYYGPGRDRDGNPPGPRGGPRTNWENPPGPRGGPGAGPDGRRGPYYPRW